MVTALKSDSIAPIAMSLTSHRSELKKAITVLGRVADKKSVMPMLGAMFVRVTDTATKLVATDLNMWATYTTTPLGRTTGDAAIKVKSLADVIGKMPEGEITITTQGMHAYVMAGSVKSHVDSYVARDYPKVPDTSALAWVSVDGGDLATCIKRTISAVCRDETRFHLNGVYLVCEGQSLRAIATDGHRLAYARSSYDDAWGLFRKGMIIPVKGATEIVKLLSKGGTCEIARDERSPNMLHVRKGDWELSVKAIDAQFPPYEQVVPTARGHLASVDLESFRGACDRAKAISGKSRLGMTLAREFGDPMLKLTCGVDERVEEAIPCSLGDTFKIGIDPCYLLDALEHVESRTSSVEIRLGGPLDPIVVCSRDESGMGPLTMRHFVVVMPMRV